MKESDLGCQSPAVDGLTEPDRRALVRQRITDQPFEQYVVPDSRVEFSGFCRRVRPGEGRRSFEVRLLQRSPGYCDVLIEASLAEGEPGSGHGCRLVLTDITERKQAKAQIQRQVGKLRTRNDELSRCNRAMGDHEVRMIESKKQVNELRGQLGRPARYPLDLDA